VVIRATYRWRGNIPIAPGFDWTWETLATRPESVWGSFDYRFTPPDPNGSDQYGEAEITFPHWAAVAAFAVLPATRLYRRLRRQHPAGYCRRCGYDLRATPGRCPECGTSR
jgi:hypothetical protein